MKLNKLIVGVMVTMIALAVSPVRAVRADAELPIDNEHFPDEFFRGWVSQSCDTDGDGFLSDEEIARVTQIYITRKGIASLEGIEYFTALKYLDCSFNKLTSLDVSKNTALETLECIFNRLISLNVSGDTALKRLTCAFNKLLCLDVSKNAALEDLSCYYNRFTEVDVSQLDYEHLSHDGIIDKERKVITVTAAPKPEHVLLNEEFFPDPEFRSYVGEMFDKDHNNVLSDGEIARATEINLDYRPMDLAGIEFFSELSTLSCRYDGLTYLNLCWNEELTELNCPENRLTYLDLSRNTKLRCLNCSMNELTALDLSRNVLLESFEGKDNVFTEINVSGLTNLIDYDGELDAENQVLIYPSSYPPETEPDKIISIGDKVTFNAKKKVAMVDGFDPDIVKVKKKGKKVIITGKAAGTVTVNAYNKKGKELGSWVVKVE